MHKVAREALPEPRERRTFPFGGTPLPSPVPSVVSTNSSRWSTYGPGEKPELPYILSHAGIEIIAEHGPASRNIEKKENIPKIMRQNYRHHLYGSYNNFGHWNVSNNICPWLGYENLPKWSTSSNQYGIHYYHPHQKFARGVKNRMPIYTYDDARKYVYYPEDEKKKKAY